jgi:hypothetical protein
MSKDTTAGAAGANNQPPANPPAEKPKARLCRVVVAVTFGDASLAPNDVIVVDVATLKSHAAELDADPAAVKYAESLKASAE